MNKLPLDTGRVNQKLETRTQILKAARKLMQVKERISLEDIADEAGISRATIYRYFNKVELLFTEASLDLHHKTPDELSEEVLDMEFSDRLFIIQNHYNSLAQEHELVFRRYLSAALVASITSNKNVRGARRVHTLRQALKPFEKMIPVKELDNLINVATVLMGIDAVVVAKDVCNLSNKEAIEMLHWGLDTLVKGMQLQL